MGLIDLLLGCPIKGRKGLSLKTVVLLAVMFMLVAGQTSALSHLALLMRETVRF